jgi:DNA (cytosine-5)-methyltransferase 1
MPPDFIIFTVQEQKVVHTVKFELKSGQNKIMWNDSHPSDDTIYFFFNSKTNKSMLFSGSDKNILSNQTRKLIIKYRNLIKEMNKNISNDTRENASSDGFKLYIRKASCQKISNDQFNNLDIINMYKYSIVKLNTIVQPPRKMKAISLFSGAGGDTLGLKNAGVNVVGFVEFDEDAIASHLENFPETTLIGQDIRNIQNDQFDQYKNKIDVIFGGFPCQSFSSGGKKNPLDERGQLYKEFVRIADYVKPTIILGENVKGLLTRKNAEGGLFINEIISSFQAIGYSITYKLLKCEQFGVPQKRSRVFIVGVRTSVLNKKNISIDDIKLPETNGVIKNLRDVCGFSLESAIKIEKDKFLNIIPNNKIVVSLDDTSKPVGSPPTNLIKCYNEEKSHGLSFDTRKKATFSGIEDIDKPSHTILCTYNRMPRLFIPMRNRTGTYLRPFTVSELKQIQDFPINFTLCGSDNSKIKQIGNAVPPIVVTEIIKYLHRMLY